MLKVGLRCGALVLKCRPVPKTISQVRCMRLYKERTVRAMYWRGRSFDAIKLPSSDKKDVYQEWNYRSEIYAFSRRLQENLSEDTLRQIFAQSSYIDEIRKKESDLNIPKTNLTSNSNLVKRGQELLELCTKPYLRYNFRLLPEEGICSIHNYLASETVMGKIGRAVGCKDIILSSEWPPSLTSLSDTMFALLAGIEKDLGFKRVVRFTADIILSYLAEKDILDDVWLVEEPEKMLSIILKNSQLPTYEPRIIFQTAVKTLEPCHVVGLFVNKRFLGSSAGETLEIAEHCAALQCLKRLFDLTESRAPMVFGDKVDSIDFNPYEKEHKYLDSWRFDISSLN